MLKNVYDFLPVSGIILTTTSAYANSGVEGQLEGVEPKMAEIEEYVVAVRFP
ncbi:hypothetical protein [Aureibacillus halotolerans]|uniref:Uncharacterized protein n=1 Tax=Aureibacillus halotolerans TaxID=1508390 RepID=A0A4R6TPH8_9BACI|nr:hypothetical protein [Aureibacillus halotolerans]TDQ33776.1 hypothetical protein EV213_1288 [Aureibacillus halotolerans]